MVPGVPGYRVVFHRPSRFYLEGPWESRAPRKLYGCACFSGRFISFLALFGHRLVELHLCQSRLKSGSLSVLSAVTEGSAHIDICVGL